VRRRQEWRRRARADLAEIARRDPQQAQRIVVAVTRYAEQEHGDVQKLTAREGTYRLRVGDWRVLFRLEDGDQIILVARILNRRDAYR